MSNSCSVGIYTGPNCDDDIFGQILMKNKKNRVMPHIFLIDLICPVPMSKLKLLLLCVAMVIWWKCL